MTAAMTHQGAIISDVAIDSLWKDTNCHSGRLER